MTGYKRLMAVGLLSLGSYVTMADAAFDPDLARQFVAQCQNTPAGHPNAKWLYWDFMLSKELGWSWEPDTYQAYLESLQNADGGFGFWARDVSTPEATMIVLKLLHVSAARPAKPQACVSYLNKQLEELSKKSRRFPEIMVLQEMYHCLISLSMLDRRIANVETYFEPFLRDEQGWEFYFRLTVTKAHGRIENPQTWKERAAVFGPTLISGGARGPDRFYALEAMHLLEGEFDSLDKIRESTRETDWAPWLGIQSRLECLETVWQRIRLGKLLTKDTPWVESWMKDNGPRNRGPLGGYGVMPGMPCEWLACLRVRDSLSKPVPLETARELAEVWKDKQQEGGFYESSPPEFDRWFNEQDLLVRRINETWQALTIFQLSGDAPANRETAAQWLLVILNEKRENLRSEHFLQCLESLKHLASPISEQSDLPEYLRNRFSHDIPFTLKAMGLLGVKAEIPDAGNRLASFLDHIRTRNLDLEISILYETFWALDRLGEHYADIGYFQNQLGRLQNPDGGIRKPFSVHSNFYDTLHALQVAKLLPVLHARYNSSLRP